MTSPGPGTSLPAPANELLARPHRAIVEYQASSEPADRLHMRTRDNGPALDILFTAEDSIRARARVAPIT
ncbi:hypothetical protein [Antrihabitans sp. YC2-6]|uniref:hypothetical protein n=1 Tax=Antrihabitans sp. YC2-6 TaxID=2799498 RepID=UPI0018F5265D|nr:hypothetical protein [Antrihabitans sp. YC2-6]MBJ8344362.1 hypothetical protein [Antrihabitans sp. YC2-6]